MVSIEINIFYILLQRLQCSILMIKFVNWAQSAMRRGAHFVGNGKIIMSDDILNCILHFISNRMDETNFIMFWST